MPPERSQKSTKSKPPPVARKPPHLSSLSPSSSPELRQYDEIGTATRTTSPGRASVSLRDVASKYSVNRNDRPPSSDGGSPAPPKPPRRAVTAAVGPPKKTTPVGAVGLVGLSSKGDKPKLPARKPTIPIKPPPELGTKTQNIDLLGGDADGKMDSWQALKPTS